jgi:hypothetical protein
VSEDPALAFASARTAQPYAGASKLCCCFPQYFVYVFCGAAVMSIAVSVVVRPSAGLRLLHAGLCGCVMMSGAVCPGVLAPLLCVLAGLMGWVVGRPCGIALELDISGVGQIRLAVYQEPGTIRRLLDGSTLWPGMLLLRLAGEDGEDGPLRSVLVLPDGVTWPELRALSLACRAVAGRTEIKTPTL